MSWWAFALIWAVIVVGLLAAWRGLKRVDRQEADRLDREWVAHLQRRRAEREGARWPGRPGLPPAWPEDDDGR